MTDFEFAGLEIAGVGEPLSLRVEIGSIRAIVSPDRRIARALVDAITGLTPCQGRVSFTDGEPIGGRIRLVPADGALLPHLTVVENIVSTRRPTARRRRAEAEDDLRAKAADYGLDDLLDRYPHEIPVGRRRMAGLARALRSRPDALVLEDSKGVPTWGALLATTWRGYQVRAGDVGSRPTSTPDLLVEVATVLVVPTTDGARTLDDDPLVVHPTAAATTVGTAESRSRVG
jgi:ABC-type taurine transport system ATPase subunit